MKTTTHKRYRPTESELKGGAKEIVQAYALVSTSEPSQTRKPRVLGARPGMLGQAPDRRHPSGDERQPEGGPARVARPSSEQAKIPAALKLSLPERLTPDREMP